MAGFVFVPINQDKRSPADFPRVTPEEQAARDADAERIVAAEFDLDMPESNRAALEAEYQHRFGKPAPSSAWTFVPDGEHEPSAGGWSFAPDEPERPSVLRNVLLNNPLTAATETGLNLATQGVALPVAGLFGLYEAGGKALGLHDRDPAGVVEHMAHEMTYQPRGELGQAATGAVMVPFEKLAEVGQAAGGKVLDETGSPVAATAVDTAINAIPMAIGPAAKGARAVKERIAPKVDPEAAAVATPEAPWGFIPLESEMPVEAKSAPRHAAAAQEGAIDRPGISEVQRPGEYASDLAGVPLDEKWMSFAEDSGSLGVPRAEMPQIKAEHRGALTQFLTARGITHAAEEVPADSLMPTQAEFSPAKVKKAQKFQGGDRSILVSSDGYVLDGHHQWLAKREAGEPVNVIRFDAPIADLLPLAHEFPSSKTAPGAAKGAEVPRQAENVSGAAGLVDDAALRAADGSGKFPAALPVRDRVVIPELAPEHAARLSEIDSRLAALADEHSTRTPAVQASLERQAMRLEAERRGLFGEEVAADSQPTRIFGRRLAEMDDADLVRYHDTLREEPHRAAIKAELATRETLATVPKVADEFARIETAGRHPAEALATAGLDHRSVSPAAADAIDFLHESRGNPERVQAFQQAVRAAMVEEPGAVRSQVGEPTTLDMATVHNSFAPGREYVGFINDTPTGAGTEAPVSTAGRGKPIRREDILIDFAKALGASIYEGRVKGKNRLGFFRPKLQETRIKRHADLETAAHEMAHLIDDRVPAIANAWRTDKALREELRSISYDQTKVNEGFAEGVRLWMTQPDVLQAKAPNVHAWLEKFADTHEYGPAMRKAQAGMTDWFGQDAIDRARSKIGDHRPLSDALDGLWDRFRQSTVDDLHGVYRMERDLNGGKLAPVGAYESARLSRASASIADGAIRYGYPVKKADGSFAYKGKGLEEILKPVAENLDDALLYFVGKSARELMTQGREHLFTPGEIDGMLRLRTPEREAAFKAYQEWNKGILDFAEAQGVINPEARRLWQRTQYLPFHRVGQPGGLKGKPGDWQGIQALTGGTENIRDVLGNMVSNAAMLIDKAVKNEARLKVAELAGKEGGGKFMAKIDTESRPVKVGGDQVLEAMLERYGIAIDGEAPAFFEFLIHGQPPAGGNVVAVLKGGKPVWYEVADSVLYRALQAIDRPNQHWLVKWLGMPKRVGQATITLTPDFMLANIARDTIMGSVMSRSGFRPIVDSLQGMRLRLTNDPLYRDYIANGGGLSSIYLDEGKLRHKLEKFYTREGIDYRTVLDTPDKLLSFIETLGDAFEMSTRLGEYKRAIGKGEHPRHAAYQGREVSTDFAMRGDSKALGFIYNTIMFLRPAVVSMDRLFRGVAHDPNKAAIGAKTGMLALASIALYLQNRDDPRYQDLPDWDRDSHWHFFVGDQHFRYPKIWEIGAVASAAERSVEKLMEADPEGLGKDFARIVAHTFSLNWKPQILAPLYDQATNRNSFTKAPIETPGMENVQPFLRAKPTTSETLKAVGMATRDLPEELQVNPVRAEALLRGYFNTWALYGLALSDKAFFGDKLPEKRADELPVVRRFYSQEPSLHTKYETQFYDMLGEAKRLQGTLRELDKLGRSDIADEKEKGALAGEAKPLERAAKNLSAINAEMRQVRRDDALSPAEKRQRLDALTVERNALLKAAVMDAKAAQTEKEQ